MINDWRKYKQLEVEQKQEQKKEMERLIKKLSMTCRSDLDLEKDKEKQKELQEKLQGKVSCLGTESRHTVKKMHVERCLGRNLFHPSSVLATPSCNCVTFANGKRMNKGEISIEATSLAQWNPCAFYIFMTLSIYSSVMLPTYLISLSTGATANYLTHFIYPEKLNVS